MKDKNIRLKEPTIPTFDVYQCPGDVFVHTSDSKHWNKFYSKCGEWVSCGDPNIHFKTYEEFLLHLYSYEKP